MAEQRPRRGAGEDERAGKQGGEADEERACATEEGCDRPTEGVADEAAVARPEHRHQADERHREPDPERSARRRESFGRASGRRPRRGPREPRTPRCRAGRAGSSPPARRRSRPPSRGRAASRERALARRVRARPAPGCWCAASPRAPEPPRFVLRFLTRDGVRGLSGRFFFLAAMRRPFDAPARTPLPRSGLARGQQSSAIGRVG